MRLTLLCAAATAASRSGAFPSPDQPLDAGGLRKARAFRLRGGAPATLLSSPSRAAIETAEALGLAAPVEPLAADLDAGDWSGRAFADCDPDELAHWIADPTQAAPGGEPMVAVVQRMGSLLDRLVEEAPHSVLIVTHAAPIRAAIVHALRLPVAAAMRIDVGPLGLVRLSWHRGWRLQALFPPAGEASG